MCGGGASRCGRVCGHPVRAKDRVLVQHRPLVSHCWLCRLHHPSAGVCALDALQHSGSLFGIDTRQAIPSLALQAGWPQPPVVPGPMDMAMIIAIAACSFSSHALIARAFLMDNAAKVSAAGYLQVCPVHGRNAEPWLEANHRACLKFAIP